MTARSSYGPRSIKRRRRTKAEMAAIREAIHAALAKDHPMSVRGLFYALTTRGVIAKTEAEYATVKRLTAEMRRSGELPYSWLADGTRWMRKPTTYSSVESALERTAQTYRRALWDDAPVAVEVWVEKEALAGVLVDVTEEWDVPLMVTRGYPSMSFLYSAAQAIWGRSEHGQLTAIRYFGDWDPSGRDIDRSIVKGIGEALVSFEGPSTALIDWGDDDPESTFGAFAHFERVGVNSKQIATWNLPTRPTKTQDPRSKSFMGDSVELDAIPPHQLRTLARQVVEQHVDQQQLELLRVAEAEERQLLERMAATVNGGGT
ncbi:MAG: hypothetical protein ACRDLL_07195 [Solirubrobacterales bacterium]